MKKLSVATEVLQAYNAALDTHLTFPGDITRLRTIRPSQLPFCPLGFFVRVSKFGALQVMDLEGSFYTKVGTAVHEVVQDYLAPSGKFLASWYCRHCGKKRLVSMKNECCDFPMAYNEIKINYKGVVGHIDAVFKDKKGRYWILDFKTSSIKGTPAKLKNPGRVYIEQIETYALYLWLEHGIKVAGVMLMFIPRDNPKEPAVWAREMDDADFRAVKMRIKTYKKMHKQVLAVETLKEALALIDWGKCKKPYCEVCRSRTPLKDQVANAYAAGKRHRRYPLSGVSK